MLSLEGRRDASLGRLGLSPVTFALITCSTVLPGCTEGELTSQPSVR